MKLLANILDSKKERLPRIPLIVKYLYGILLVIFLTTLFLKGVEYSIIMAVCIVTVVSYLFAISIYRIFYYAINTSRKNFVLRSILILTILLPLSAFLISLLEGQHSYIGNAGTDRIMLFYLGACILDGLIILSAVYILNSGFYYRNIIQYSTSIKLEDDSLREDVAKAILTDQQPLSTIEKVVKAIQMRSMSAKKMISNSLFIMVILVIVGGGASIGTVALNEMNNIRQLESERQKLVGLNNELTIYNSNPNVDSAFMAAFKAHIAADFGKNASYQPIIESIQRQSNISWPDIAMRITIAALTLFLVQIFFHIYKYNQQEVSRLYEKIEILELFNGTTGGDQKTLREQLLSKINGGPSFSKDPTNPTEQIINILKESGKKSD